ncbi:MAG: AAA family ATPase, partial [Cyanobacteria bacterium P01_E01_bin.34]
MPQPAPLSTTIGQQAAHITVRSLTKTFAGRDLYRDFNLDLLKGKVTCIFGPNGCGKSTL